MEPLRTFTPPIISCNRCRWFVAEVLPEAERVRARLDRYPSHRAFLEQEIADQEGWRTLRGRGGRGRIVRAVVRRMEAAWAPSVPPGAHVRQVRLGELVLLLMGAQSWLDHLRRQPAGPDRGQVHAEQAGLSRFYRGCGRALDATPKDWPARRSAAMIRVVEVLLRLPERTLRRRLQRAGAVEMRSGPAD